jgi:hypothetical protein
MNELRELTSDDCEEIVTEVRGMAKPELTRKTYYATKLTLEGERGALHESANCAAMRGAVIGNLSAKDAAALIEASRRADGRKMVYQCERCKGL